VRLLNGEEERPPTAVEKIQGAIRQLAMTIAFKGEAVGVREMRKHLAWYLKGLPHTAPLKEAIFRVKTQEETILLLENYLEKLEAKA
jgi:tRNA-dihydrouridine synthase